MEKVSVGQVVTSASGNTSGVALEVIDYTSKSGEQMLRVFVETDEGLGKWITLKG